jgi:hypothetical protein
MLAIRERSLGVVLGEKRPPPAASWSPTSEAILTLEPLRSR